VAELKLSIVDVRCTDARGVTYVVEMQVLQPEALSARPFRDALEAARVASFTVEEWDAYILARIAIQSEQAALAHAERRGRELGHELGERRGKAHGLRHGLRHGVEALCRVLGIELTDERRRELASLPATGLEALLARLQERRSWT
jgi:hypothetical protein